jgi:II/X family phage/plasmid replication protein
MIDWISGTLPFTHKHVIGDGFHIDMDANGDIKRRILKRREVVGSFETGIHIRTDLSRENLDGTYPFLRFDGNPVKLFQGHNLWGTNDIHGLVRELYAFLMATIDGAIPRAMDLQMVNDGAVFLTRVDINESYELPSLRDCLAWIRSAENSVRLKHRGRGEMTGSTLYYGKHSTRWAVKIYSKGQEVRDHGMSKQPGIFGLPHCMEYADRALRPELVLRGPELKKRDLDLLANWGDNTPEDLHRELLAKLEFAEAMTITPTILDDLPGSLRGAYALWKDGHDLRQVYSRPTFYRYRSQLLAHGIDISIKQEGTPNNVVPLVRILEANPVGVPDWAIGTNLYFEPRRFA